MILYLISNNTEVYEGVGGLRQEVEVVPLLDEEETVFVFDGDTELPRQDDESGEDGVGDPLAGVRPQFDVGQHSELANMEPVRSL